MFQCIKKLENHTALHMYEQYAFKRFFLSFGYPLFIDLIMRLG